MGQEPDPQKMPLDTSDFPEDVQVAFFMLSLLPDKWDTMSGFYMGKEWGSLETFMDLYDIDSRKNIFLIMKIYEGLLMGYRAEKQQQEEKRKKQKEGSSGKNYTYNVKG